MARYWLVAMLLPPLLLSACDRGVPEPAEGQAAAAIAGPDWNGALAQLHATDPKARAAAVALLASEQDRNRQRVLVQDFLKSTTPRAAFAPVLDAWGPNGIEDFLRVVAEPSDQVGTLAAMHDPVAIDVLIGLLGSEDTGKRKLAADVLLEKGEQARAQLLAAVAQPDLPADSPAATALRDLRDQQGRLLNADARLGATLLLWQLEPASTPEQRLEPLLHTPLQALRDPSPLAAYPQARDYLQRRSQDVDPRVRGNALLLLAAWGTEVTEHLLPLLNEEHPIELRTDAARALSHVRDPRAIQPLLDMLAWEAASEWDQIEAGEDYEDMEAMEEEGAIADDAPPVYDAAAHDALARAAQDALRVQGGAAVKPVLEAEYLGDIMQEHGRAILRTMDPDELVPALVPLLKAPGEFDAGAVMDLLVGSNDPRAVVPILDTLPDADDGAFNSVRGRLLQFGTVAVEPCRTRVRDPDPATRSVCIGVLAQMDAPGHAEVFRAALQDDDAAVIAEAAQGVGLAGDQSARDRLVQLLQHDDAVVRVNAADALGRLKDPVAVAPIIAAIGTLDRWPETYLDVAEAEAQYEREAELDERILPPIHNAGIYALGAIGAPAVQPILDALEEQHSPAIAARLVEALGRIKEAKDDPRSATVLAAAMESGDDELKAAAARATAALKPTDWVAALVKGLEREAADKGGGLVADFAMALGESGAAEAGEALLAVLGNLESEWQQDMVIAALGRNGSEPARRWLEGEVGKGNLQAIAMAHEFFIRQGVPGSEPLIAQALDEKGSMVMAVDMLNSGNSTLREAAEQWAADNGYQITTYWGASHGGPRWGGGH